jgi:hypothetical protein
MLYEIVRAQIRLGHAQRFADLHENTLVPMLRDAGIEPVLFLLTEVGPHHRFLDIYRYPSWDAYDERTARFLSDDRIGAYYDAVERCILGSIEIELAKEFSCTPPASRTS